MAKEKKKGFVLRALDTVEHVGNALPNPATIFLILTGVVIVLSAICAACGVSVTYDFLDNSKGEITQKTVAAVSLLAPDSIRHMVTTVVNNFTGFFALGTVFTIMIGVGVADGSGFMSALLRKVVAATPKACVTAVVVQIYGLETKFFGNFQSLFQCFGRSLTKRHSLCRSSKLGVNCYQSAKVCKHFLC